MKKFLSILAIFLLIFSLNLDTNAQEISQVANVDYTLFPKDPGDNYDQLVTGTKYYVATNGNNNNPGTFNQPFATISHAVQVAQPNDGIFVRGGTYNVVDYTQGIELNKNNIYLVSYNKEEVILKQAGWNYALVITGDNLLVDGLTFDGFGAAVNFGRASTQKNLIMKNIKVRNSGVGFQGTYDSSPLILDGALFKNIQLTNPQTSGYILGLTCGGPACHNVKIVDSYFNLAGAGSGSGADGIAMENGDNILIENTTVEGTSADAFDFKATRIGIVNCVAKHIARNGIKLWYGGDIINTLIFDTGADSAVVFVNNGNYRILNSIIADHNKNGAVSYTAGFGYNVDATNMNIEIKNTIFHHNVGSVWINPDANLVIKNTIFSGGTQTGRYLDYDQRYGLEPINTPLTQLDPSLKEVENVNFVNTNLDDFHLQETSPAIDAGIVIDGLTIDLDGNARPVGTAYDVGVYEFNSTAQPPVDPPVEPPIEPPGYLVYNITFDSAIPGEVHGGINDTGKIGKGYYFDGNDYIKLQIPQNFTDEFSFAIWLKVNASQSTTILTNKDLNIEPYFELRMQSSKLSLASSDGETSMTYNSNKNIVDKKWHHIALTMSKNDVIKIYLDGQKVKELNIVSLTTIENNNNLYLGAYQGNQKYIKGVLDEVKVYNKTLTDAEILQDFQI